MGPATGPDGAVTPRAHEALPKPGTAYTMSGTNTGCQANMHNPAHYPVEALCTCGEIIRLEHWLAAGDGGDWVHTGRKPGDPR